MNQPNNQQNDNFFWKNVKDSIPHILGFYRNLTPIILFGSLAVFYYNKHNTQSIAFIILIILTLILIIFNIIDVISNLENSNNKNKEEKKNKEENNINFIKVIISLIVLLFLFMPLIVFPLILIPAIDKKETESKPNHQSEQVLNSYSMKESTYTCIIPIQTLEILETNLVNRINNEILNTTVPDEKLLSTSKIIELENKEKIQQDTKIKISSELLDVEIKCNPELPKNN